MNPLEVIKGPRLKLAGTYLLIIMVMSGIFSLAIYNISDRELRNQRQLKIPQTIPIELADEFNILRDVRYKQAKQNLRGRLVLFNMLVLLFGSVLSYALARRALQPIEEAFEAQNRFTSDASHEIRTPLTVMKSEIEVALRDKKLKTKDAREILESNLEEVKKLEALTNGLLQLARQENKELHKTNFSAKKIIDASISQIKLKAKEKKIKIDKTAVQNIDMLAEPISLEQAVLIILDNAVKYSPEKSTISIEVKNNRFNQEINICDQGPGITKEALPNIFERFYRADESRTKTQDKEGYGLGLPIAKQIIESHGGEISVSNRKEGGLKVQLFLPKK